MNKTVADLLEDFGLRHARVVHENEKRLRGDGQIQKLEEQKRALLMQKLECAFLAADEGDLDAQIRTLEEQERGLAEKKGLLVPYDCQMCKDTGIIGKRYCRCFLNEVYINIYGATDIAALDMDFEHADLSVFDGEKQLPMGKTQRQIAELVYGICQKYVAGFPKTPRQNLLLRGKAGLGKTYLLNCMAVAAKRQEIDVCLIRASALFDAFFRHRMGEEMPLHFLQEAGLLMIDDLGTEPVTQNVTVEYLFDLLNRRIEAGRHTVIATNVDDLQARYGERISSRMEGGKCCAVLLMDGDDIRMTK